jgi:hypothetical protein
MENYNIVKKIVEENECTLLTSFEDFESRRETVMNKSHLYVRVDFIGVCGHNSSAVFTNFKSRGTGKRCKECVKKNTYSILRNNSAVINNTTELNSIELIIKYLSPYYDIRRTNEGCRADLAIKEKGKEGDEWIPVQVKSTKGICHKMYSFRGIKKDYTGMLIICICTTEEKIWIIPYSDLSLKAPNLNISEYSKYNDYSCGNNLILNQYIDKYKDKCIRKSLEECMLPISNLQQQEQEYVKKREKAINFLQFKRMDIQNTPTDFMVNGKKVQEKVCGFNNIKHGLILALASNNGKNENGIRKFRTYRYGENDYYWFHSSIDNIFWIVPEQVLYDKGYISDPDKTSNNTSFSIRINKENNYGIREWIKEYEYNYDSPDKEKITKLFE